MIVNRQRLLEAQPIHNMLPGKHTLHGVSHGLSEAGYDIRIKQDVTFVPPWNRVEIKNSEHDTSTHVIPGRFALASSVELFQMPNWLVGVVHDKSTWARRGLSVFNTVIEPGWKGYLTLELVYHGHEVLHVPAGAGIAQVLFQATTDPAVYEGKYQDQPNQPIAARES
jgi:dCTP deaminase